MGYLRGIHGFESSYARIDRCGTAQPSKLRTIPLPVHEASENLRKARAPERAGATSGRMRVPPSPPRPSDSLSIHLRCFSISSLHTRSRVPDRRYVTNLSRLSDSAAQPFTSPPRPPASPQTMPSLLGGPGGPLAERGWSALSSLDLSRLTPMLF